MESSFPKNGALMVGDLESNGLLFEKKEVVDGELSISPPADTIWMACHRDPLTGKCYDFINDECLKKYSRAIDRHNKKHNRDNVKVYPLSMLPEFWEHCGEQYYHFGMKFDFPLVEKLMGYHLDRKKRKDTLTISQTLNSDRERVKGSGSGPHSVESWAVRLGKEPKVEHEDWMNFSIAMYKRCWRDVEIQCHIKEALDMEIRADKIECNIDWTKALELEHMAAFWISYSEQWGFTCDEKFARELVAKLDKLLEETEDELLPDMPFRQMTTAGSGCGTLVNWEGYCDSILKNTNLTQVPDKWEWPDKDDGGRNRQSPIWKVFKLDGDYSESVITFFNGKDAVDAQPYIPERFHVKTVKEVKEKRDKDGNILRDAVKGVKGVRARKSIEAKDAVPRKASCYEDEAGITDPPMYTTKVEDVKGSFTRIKWANYNLGSNDQVKEYLTRFTEWIPTEFTDKGNPKLTEDSFESIGHSDLGLKLKNYLIDRSRRTNILNFKNPTKGWLNLIREDGRITPYNNTMGTPTARSRHSGLVNVPSGNARWGSEMRKCWTAYEGGKLLGIDSSGLEFRALADEMDDEVTTQEIIDGDIHSIIWELIDDFSDSRANTKNIEYALNWRIKNLLNSVDTLQGIVRQYRAK